MASPTLFYTLTIAAPTNDVLSTIIEIDHEFCLRLLSEQFANGVALNTPQTSTSCVYVPELHHWSITVKSSSPKFIEFVKMKLCFRLEDDID